MIHYYIWNFVLEVSSVALAALVIYSIVMGTGIVVAKISHFIDTHTP